MNITDPLTKQIHIKMSGCPNGCSQHHIATIGFYGASIKGGRHTIPDYIPHIAGNFEGGDVVFGHRLKARLPAKRVPEAVRALDPSLRREPRRRRELQRLRRPHRLRRLRGADLGPEAAGRVQRGQPSLLHRLEPLRALQVERGEGECAVYGAATTEGLPGAAVNGNGAAPNGNGRQGILHEASATAHATAPAADLDGLGFDPEIVAAKLEDASAEEALRWALGTSHRACTSPARSRRGAR